eukprot:scaffold12316_cov58-Phaeocystis_antarctica.AAC.3
MRGAKPPTCSYGDTAPCHDELSETRERHEQHLDPARRLPLDGRVHAAQQCDATRLLRACRRVHHAARLHASRWQVRQLEHWVIEAQLCEGAAEALSSEACSAAEVRTRAWVDRTLCSSASTIATRSELYNYSQAWRSVPTRARQTCQPRDWRISGCLPLRCSTRPATVPRANPNPNPNPNPDQVLYRTCDGAESAQLMAD